MGACGEFLRVREYAVKNCLLYVYAQIFIGCIFWALQIIFGPSFHDFFYATCLMMNGSLWYNKFLVFF